MNFFARSIGTAANLLTFGALSKEYERAFYEGAKQTRLNRDFNISNSHFEIQVSGDRDALRARARWLSANNPIAKSIDKSIIKNVVGTGIGFQSKILKDDVASATELNNQIESLWNEYCQKQNFDVTKRMNMNKFQKLVLKTKLVDGEDLIQKVYTKDTRFPLKFKLVEADKFDISITKFKKNDVYSGVEVDENEAPVAYHLKKDAFSFKSERFPAGNFLHFYDSERSSQYRGISDYAQVINNLKDFAAYNDSEIVKNRVLASFATFIKTGDVGGGMFGDKQKGDAIGSKDPIKEITTGMVKYLRPNESVETVQSNQLGTSYNDFITNTVRLIAIGRDVSYELAIRDYSKVNYSSARAGIIQDNKRFDDEQKMLIDEVLNPIFYEWLDSVVLAGTLKMPNDYFANPNKYKKAVWVTPAREWVDPLKDIKATEKEIELGLNSRTRAAAQRGRNFEEIADEIVTEEKLLKEKREKAGLLPDLQGGVQNG